MDISLHQELIFLGMLVGTMLLMASPVIIGDLRKWWRRRK
jgi:hypothetical protein